MSNIFEIIKIRNIYFVTKFDTKTTTVVQFVCNLYAFYPGLLFQLYFLDEIDKIYWKRNKLSHFIYAVKFENKPGASIVKIVQMFSKTEQIKHNQHCNRVNSNIQIGYIKI